MNYYERIAAEEQARLINEAYKRIEEIEAKAADLGDAKVKLLDTLEVIRTIATPPHHENALVAIADMARSAIQGKGDA